MAKERIMEGELRWFEPAVYDVMLDSGRFGVAHWALYLAEMHRVLHMGGSWRGSFFERDRHVLSDPDAWLASRTPVRLIDGFKKYYETGVREITAVESLEDVRQDGTYPANLKYLRIDMNIPIDVLRKQMKAWLDDARKDLPPLLAFDRRNPTSITATRLREWSQRRIAALFDLEQWAKLHGKRFGNEQLIELIFPGSVKSPTEITKSRRSLCEAISNAHTLRLQSVAEE